MLSTNMNSKDEIIEQHRDESFQAISANELLLDHRVNVHKSIERLRCAVSKYR